VARFDLAEATNAARGLAEAHNRLGVISHDAVDGRWIPEKVEV